MSILQTTLCNEHICVMNTSNINISLNVSYIQIFKDSLTLLKKVKYFPKIKKEEN